VAKPKIVIVEEDESIVATLKSAIEDGYEILRADPTHKVLDLIQEEEPLVILLGLEPSSNPASKDGVSVLHELRQAGCPVKVVVYTEESERKIAVQAVREGAFDVLSKPLDLNLLKSVVRRAVWLAELEREGLDEASRGGREEFDGMLGTSPGIRRIFDAIRKVATTDVPIFITGERGTGKELTAKAIHQRGERRQAPFISLNCGAIPEGLLEAELFGEERHGSAGGVVLKTGKIERAESGTLFLDEVNELPSALQAKLSRCLQDRTFERIGGQQPIEMNVRIITAGTVSLKEAVEKGTFRKDLYAQLGTVHINVPPLRERGDDVLLMAMAFLRQAETHGKTQMHGFTREALEAMRAYAWPDNVRELSGKIGRAVVMAEGRHVTPVDLGIPQQAERGGEESISLKVNQQRIETDLILKAFTLSQGNLSRAAHELGISRSTLYRRLRQYGMERTLDARRTLGVPQRAWTSDH
jgi:two-component system NtrC family response regulator